MAADDGSVKQARLFPCLAILRYTVATVVTVLAVVVIVMVIAVGVRPDDVSVSVVQGHVGTTDLWKETTTYVDAATAKAIYPSRGGGPTRRCVVNDYRGGLPSSSALSDPCSFGTDDDGGGFGDYGRRPLTRTVYTPVDALSLEVALSVDNQSGRGSIYCGSINVTFRAPAGIEIGVLRLPSSLDFHMKPQTSHKISRVVTFNDTTVLRYIAGTFGGESSFAGTVEVAMNTSFVVTQLAGHHTTPSIVKLVCSPVLFSVADATATAAAVQCIKSN